MRRHGGRPAASAEAWDETGPCCPTEREHGREAEVGRAGRGDVRRARTGLAGWLSERRTGRWLGAGGGRWARPRLTG